MCVGGGGGERGGGVGVWVGWGGGGVVGGNTNTTMDRAAHAVAATTKPDCSVSSCHTLFRLRNTQKTFPALFTLTSHSLPLNGRERLPAISNPSVLVVCAEF